MSICPAQTWLRPVRRRGRTATAARRVETIQRAVVLREAVVHTLANEEDTLKDIDPDG